MMMNRKLYPHTVIIDWTSFHSDARNTSYHIILLISCSHYPVPCITRRPGSEVIGLIIISLTAAPAATLLYPQRTSLSP